MFLQRFIDVFQSSIDPDFGALMMQNDEVFCKFLFEVLPQLERCVHAVLNEHEHE